jgi:putative tryptophan/tyrosine transport system substrate-binding protein
LRRRQFITLLGGTAATLPLAARAQQPTMPRVGFIWIGARGTDLSQVAGLRQGLSDRGYVFGRNLALEERYADGNPDRIPVLIAELLALRIDVLVTAGTPLTRAAQSATKTVPIVSVTGNPVGTGLVTSLSHPGGNITGLSLLSGDYSAKWLELLKQVVPKLHRVVALSNPDNSVAAGQLEHMREAAQALGLELTVFSVRPSEFETSFAAITTELFDGLIVTDDAFIATLLPRIIALAADRHLPAVYAYSGIVQQGALMSYSSNFFAMYRAAAGYVDRILKGARPSDLPIEQATEVALSINLKTAKALDVTIPPTLLATADEVIE